MQSCVAFSLLSVPTLVGALLVGRGPFIMQRKTASLRAVSAPLESYEAPAWTPDWLNAPIHRVRLGHLPTPVEEWRNIYEGCMVYIKRDDYTASEMSGNKIRKLEFLLAEAIRTGCDSVCTVGGIQSNHCRATAVAARRLDLEPHLVQRVQDPQSDPGLVGNLLISRMVDAQLHLFSPSQFAERGAWPIVCGVVKELQENGRKPYAFPSGGSSPLGTWGYLQCVAEINSQLEERDLSVERIYFACGSGGTAAGLALGLHLSSSSAELVGLCVDDTPDFFYDKLDSIYAGLGAPPEFPPARNLLRLQPAIGNGYAVSTEAELDFILTVARATGVLLDPVYSGKAALGMVEDLRRRPTQSALFLHTGGHLGLYAKDDQISALLRRH